jgi:hypothetical protein
MKMKKAATALLALLGTVLGGADARAAEDTEGFHFGGGVNVANDSNVFRTAPTDPAGVASLYTTTLYGLASFDRTYGQQRVFANVNFGRVLYSGGFSSYDYGSQTVDAGYRLGSWDRFNVGIEWVRSAAQVNFADTVFKVPDVVTRDTVTTDVDQRVIGDWHLVASASGSWERYSDAASSISNLDRFGGQVGVRYVPIYGNRIDLSLGQTRGRYPNGATTAFGDAGYRDRLADLSVSWHFSGHSRLDGHAGYLQRRNDTLTFRDFSGLSSDLAWVWAATGKLTVTLSGSRVMGAAGDVEFLTAVTKTLRLAPAWQATEKIKLEVGLYRSVRDYFGQGLQLTPGGTLPAAGHIDTIFGGSLTATWAMESWLTLSADLRSEHRDSNLSNWAYSDRIGSMSVRVWL